MIDRTQYKAKNLIKYSIATLVMVPFLQILYIGWIGLIHSALPITYWVEYDRSEPMRQHYFADEPLTMRSFYRTNRETDINFDDRLVCDWGDGPVSVSEQHFKRIITDKKDFSKTGVMWTYIAKRPSITADCYIDAVLTLNLDYAAEKTLDIRTGGFTLDCRTREQAEGDCEDLAT